MGQCAGKGASRNERINELLEQEDNATVASSTSSKKSTKGGSFTKLLLLGTGNSGKSTVFKQFQLMHNNGFTESEKEFYRTLMRESTIATIKRLLQNANDLLFEGLIKDGDIDEESIMVIMSKRANDVDVSGESSVSGYVTNNNDAVGFSEALESGRKARGSKLGEGQLGKARRNTDLSAPSTSTTERGTNLSEYGRDKEGKDSSSPKLEQSIPTDDRVEGTSFGSTVISEEIVHMADIIRSLPIGTSLLQKYPVKVLSQAKGGKVEEELTLTVAEMLKRVWNDPVIKRVYSMEGKMPTLESPIAFYMQEIDRIAAKDFVPTEEDILHSRKQTRQVQQLHFTVEGKKFSLIDVGGQRIERRKWINYFDSVDAVIFVVGLDGYNQLCLEDGRTNRMREALELFKDICDSPYFTATNFMLFLNKCDLFAKKIATVPLNVCFRSYTGNQNDYDQSIQYIRKRFTDTHTRHVLGRTLQAQGNLLQPRVYPHVTCSLATEQMRFVIATCQSICLRKGLAQCGIAAM